MRCMMHKLTKVQQQKLDYFDYVEDWGESWYVIGVNEKWDSIYFTNAGETITVDTLKEAKEFINDLYPAEKD